MSRDFRAQTLNLIMNPFLPMESRLHHQKWRLDENAGCDTTRSVAASCLISIFRQAGSQSSRVPAEGASKLEPVVPPSFGSNARCFGGDALVSLLVPDALLIAAVNCRITARLRPPTLRFRCAGPTALLVTPPRHVVVSAASPDAAVRLSVIDEERKRWKNMKRCPESADTVKVRLV